MSLIIRLVNVSAFFIAVKIPVVLGPPSSVEFDDEIKPPSIIVFIFILTASLLYLAFFYSIARGQISLTGTIVAGYPIVTIILSYIFLKEHLTFLQYGGIAFILSGGVFVALPGRANNL